MSQSGSVLFHPFRVIGLYCNAVPVAVQRLGNVHFVAAALDDTFQIYNSDKLTLVQVGEHHPTSIKAIAMHKKLTFTAAGSTVYISHRGKMVGELNGHTMDVTHLLTIGDILVTGGKDHTINVWNSRTRHLMSRLEFEENVNITAICHPDTYLNKLVIGTKEGSLQLWNFHSRKLVYNFTNLGCGITCIEQSPAVDVVAIGLEDGRIIIHNLRTDTELFSFKQEEGYVTALAFRTDGHSVLASASKSGTIALWDLEKRRLIYLMRGCHDGIISTLKFFASEPLLLSSGADNSLKIWIFDQTDGSGRLLKYRAGHSQPPHKIRFYFTSSNILSASRDKSFRLFSTIKDQRSREFSQGKLESKAKKLKNKTADDLKLPPILNFDACIAKQRQWDNILTCHRGSTKAYTWRKERFALGQHTLKTTGPSAPIRSVAISACGNFAIIGSASGWIDKYNIQSGQHRGSYCDNKESAHSQSVEGLAVDAVNRYLISAGLDGLLKFWQFKDHKLIKTVELEAPATNMQLHKESGLVAVACDDLCVRVYDIVTQTLVRKLTGHTGTITDIAFSGDGRWIASACADGTLRVFDLPTSQCIDWVQLDSPITSLTFSPRSDFLATTHVDSKGIFLWANKHYFSGVFIKPITSKEPKRIRMPSLATLLQTAEERDSTQSSEDADDHGINIKMEEEEDPWAIDTPDGEGTVSPLAKELITLSSGAPEKWKSLVNLDVIRERNKPIRPPETPKSAPFLLPTLPGLEPTFIPTVTEQIEEVNPRLIDLSKLRPKTKFILALEAADKSGNYDEVLKLLHKMSASAVDFEVRSLSKENDFYEYKLFLKFVLAQLKACTNFEVIQSVLNVFLKVQGEYLPTSKELMKLAQQVLQQQRVAWQRLQDMMYSSLCMVSYFSNMPS